MMVYGERDDEGENSKEAGRYSGNVVWFSCGFEGFLWILDIFLGFVWFLRLSDGYKRDREWVLDEGDARE